MADQTSEKPMQLAEILSDLVSLRVCDSTAALALVSARPNTQSANANGSADSTAQGPEDSAEAQDKDLRRAKDLVALHYAVKEAHKRGELGKGLMEARKMVEGAVGQ